MISNITIYSIREALQCLTLREQKILILRYGLDDEHIKTQKEISKMFGCSRSLIGRQEQKALTKMRNTMKLKDM